MTNLSIGECALCGKTAATTGMSRHVAKCAPAHDETSGEAVPLLQLRVSGDALARYWLDVEVKAGAQLTALDEFLRAIWLECCGHMSAFQVGHTRYTSDPLDYEEERSLDVRVSEALKRVAGPFRYEYDFGSTTELRLRVTGRREGRIGHHAVRLLARNQAPVWPCIVCGQPATLVCAQCIYGGEPFLCEAHSGEHDCGEEYLLPVVNSPRMGVCGYTG